MSFHLADTLAQLRAVREAEAAVAGKDVEPTALVFANKAGRPLDEAHFRRLFHRFLAGAGLRRIRLHDLRHTYASILL